MASWRKWVKGVLGLRSGVAVPMSAAEFVAGSSAAYKRSAELKRTNPEIAWYPYDSFGNVRMLEQLLVDEEGMPIPMGEVLANGPVLDLCCGDGDLSFYLDSLGYAVQAVDWPETNYNGMRGVREMKRLTGAKVSIAETDLDQQFSLPGAQYQAAFFFGGLYHLKNPFFVLETVARQCRYCFLSTRIARFSADGKTDLQHLPVAYLLAASESNSDDTNYWIFSREGLRVLLDRAHWRICSAVFAGETSASDPVSLEGDERAFYLLESKLLAEGDLYAGRKVTLLAGWHGEENGAWRWTERRFVVRVEMEAGGHARKVALQVVVPALLNKRVGAVMLRCSVNGTEAGSMVLAEEGVFVFSADVPQVLAGREELVIAFEVDQFLPPEEADERERGIIVMSRSLRDLVG
ncbi:MAG: hypothetical protein HYX27_22545 [Acidobacteria bacterium]|nr:hypothetical protein [Acidobacteriota bacterium]